MVKSFTFNVKSVTDEGTFTGILSKYGNVDRVNDRVMKGAFADTIKELGTRRPLLFSHKQDEPVGSVELVDTDESLNVEGRLNMDVNRAREVYSLLKAGDINSMSIGYSVKDSKYDADGVRNLLALDLYEASLVCVPANAECLITSVKSGENMATSKFASLSFLKDMSEEDRDACIKEIEDLIAQDEQDEQTDEEEEPEKPAEEEPSEQPAEEDEKSDDEDDAEEEQKAFDAIVKQINAITAKLR